MEVVRDSDIERRGGDVLGDGARGSAALCGGERGAISKSGSSDGSSGLASDSCACHSTVNGWRGKALLKLSPL